MQRLDSLEVSLDLRGVLPLPLGMFGLTSLPF